MHRSLESLWLPRRQRGNDLIHRNEPCIVRYPIRIIKSFAARPEPTTLLFIGFDRALNVESAKEGNVIRGNEAGRMAEFIMTLGEKFLPGKHDPHRST